MKYELLKTHVARELYTRIKSNIHNYDASLAILMDAIAERRTFIESAQILADKVFNTVMAWDIRRVGKLRELFPEHFPKSLKKGKLYIEMDENADWVVFTE